MSSWDRQTIEPDDVRGPTGSRPDMDRVRRDGRAAVTKTARGRGRTSLRRESEILDRLRLNGMVEIIEIVESDETTTLLMEDAGRQTFADPIGLSSDELCRALRRSCAAVHELHLSGWTHGAVAPEHVVLGPRGRARLCSFGATLPIDRADRAAVGADVAQLISLIDHVASLGSPDATLRGRIDWSLRSRRLRRIADDARSADRGADTSLTADDLGSALSMIDAPRHVRSGTSGHRSGRRAPATALWLAVAVAATLSAVAWTIVSGSGGSSAQARSDGATAPSTSTGPVASAPLAPTRVPLRCAGWPAVGSDLDGDGCPETIQVNGNVVTVDNTAYRLGADGDLAAVGDWDCDGRSTARLVRPSTGELFEFPGWASEGTPSEAYLVSTLRGAKKLRRVAAEVAVNAASCDRMLVTLQDGTEIEPIPLTSRDTP